MTETPGRTIRRASLIAALVGIGPVTAMLAATARKGA